MLTHWMDRYSGFGNTSYSSTYESSANAYMLMYRQSDPSRNISEVTQDMVRQEVLDMVANHEGKVSEKKEEAARKRDELAQKVPSLKCLITMSMVSVV